jgi:hypothetical protein
MNDRMPRVASGARRFGTTTPQRVRQLVAPSRLAASSSSRGKPRMYCRSRMMPKDEAIWGITSAAIVSSHPRRARMT